MTSGYNRALPDPAVLEREVKALDLRRAGASYEAIATAVGFDTAAGARAAVRRGLARAHQEPAAEVRQLEAERLDRLQAAVWVKAVKGDTWSVDRVLAIMRQRADLLGLNHSHRIDERKQRVDELQAAMVFRAVIASLDEAGITGADRDRALAALRDQVAGIAEADTALPEPPVQPVTTIEGTTTHAEEGQQ